MNCSDETLAQNFKKLANIARPHSFIRIFRKYSYDYYFWIYTLIIIINSLNRILEIQYRCAQATPIELHRCAPVRPLLRVFR